MDPGPGERADRGRAQGGTPGAGRPGPRRRELVSGYDFLATYVDDLPARCIDIDAIRAAGVRIGADPLGGASVAYWGEIAARYGLDLTVVNPDVDPTFGFMTLDWDGKIRMDCSSPYAMASLIAQKDKFQLATGNDADADRHGIVTPDGGLMNPNHYLAVAISYLFRVRTDWPADAAIGKTLVSSSMIDRVAADLGRQLDRGAGRLQVVRARACSTARSASAARRAPGRRSCAATAAPWTTDKDGILLDLLASEILATTGRTPSEHYRRPDREVRRARRTPGSTPRRPARRRRSWPSCRRSRSPPRSWTASRSPRC